MMAASESVGVVVSDKHAAEEQADHGQTSDQKADLLTAREPV